MNRGICRVCPTRPTQTATKSPVRLAPSTSVSQSSASFYRSKPRPHRLDRLDRLGAVWLPVADEAPGPAGARVGVLLDLRVRLGPHTCSPPICSATSAGSMFMMVTFTPTTASIP